MLAATAPKPAQVTVSYVRVIDDGVRCHEWSIFGYGPNGTYLAGNGRSYGSKRQAQADVRAYCSLRNFEIAPQVCGEASEVWS
jgi:hypothetical protein